MAVLHRFYCNCCYKGLTCISFCYNKTCPKRPLKKNGFQDRLSLNEGQEYCGMLQESILQYFRPSLSYHLIFIFVYFEWPLKTGFTLIFQVLREPKRAGQVDQVLTEYTDCIQVSTHRIMNIQNCLNIFIHSPREFFKRHLLPNNTSV